MGMKALFWGWQVQRDDGGGKYLRVKEKIRGVIHCFCFKDIQSLWIWYPPPPLKTTENALIHQNGSPCIDPFSFVVKLFHYFRESLQRLSQIELPKLHQMMAEVQQNANVLVDGVTVQEEVLYTYEHYYG